MTKPQASSNSSEIPSNGHRDTVTSLVPFSRVANTWSSVNGSGELLFYLLYEVPFSLFGVRLEADTLEPVHFVQRFGVHEDSGFFHKMCVLMLNAAVFPIVCFRFAWGGMVFAIYFFKALFLLVCCVFMMLTNTLLFFIPGTMDRYRKIVGWGGDAVSILVAVGTYGGEAWLNFVAFFLLLPFVNVLVYNCLTACDSVWFTATLGVTYFGATRRKIRTIARKNARVFTTSKPTSHFFRLPLYTDDQPITIVPSADEQRILDHSSGCCGSAASSTSEPNKLSSEVSASHDLNDTSHMFAGSAARATTAAAAAQPHRRDIEMGNVSSVAAHVVVTGSESDSKDQVQVHSSSRPGRFEEDMRQDQTVFAWYNEENGGRKKWIRIRDGMEVWPWSLRSLTHAEGLIHESEDSGKLCFDDVELPDNADSKVRDLVGTRRSALFVRHLIHGKLANVYNDEQDRQFEQLVMSGVDAWIQDGVAYIGTGHTLDRVAFHDELLQRAKTRAAAGRLFVHVHRRIFVVTNEAAYQYSGEDFALYQSFTNGSLDQSSASPGAGFHQQSVNIAVIGDEDD
jgi:hypothetical protein